MSIRSPRGWRTGTWMNRTLVIVVALSVFFSFGPLADEIPSGFDPGSSKAKGLILTFEDWPPDSVDTDPLLQKLHSAGSRRRASFRGSGFGCSSGMNGKRAAGRKTCVLNCCWTIEPLPCWIAVNRITCCIPPGPRPAATSRGVMPVRCRCARPRARGSLSPAAAAPSCKKSRDSRAWSRGSCRIPCR